MIYTVTMNPSLDKYFVVDHLRSEMINRGSVSEVIAGGKGINVSRYLKIFGINSVVLTFTGGYAGQSIVAALRSSGFSVEDFRADGSTRENITLFNTENSKIYKLNEYGPTISSDEIEKLYSRVQTLACEGDIWVLAGSLPPGIKDNFYSELIEALHRKKALVMVDTSGMALKEAVNARPEYIHANLDEVAEIHGRKLLDRKSLVDAVQELIRRFSIKALLCSLGEDGALLACESEIYSIAAPGVQVVSTTGAGDAMVSAFLFALQKGYSMEEIGKWAVAAGSIKVTVPGTGVFRKKDVQAIMGKITITRIK
ncbi:MAG: 1-phosphofructokinase family hexose kinase [Anaerolineales bacterium]|nr:1-phosphofructokinase family hexose kinase [Anaerolineales bacterium]